MPIEPDKILEELFKFRLSQLKVDSEYATGVISQHVRAISYGLVALIIPFFTTEAEKLPKILQNNPDLALLCSLFGFLAVIADLCHNNYADLCARSELDRVVKNLNINNLRVESPSDFMMKSSATNEAILRKFFYTLKITLTFAGVLILAFMLLSLRK